MTPRVIQRVALAHNREGALSCHVDSSAHLYAVCSYVVYVCAGCIQATEMLCEAARWR